MSYCKSCGAYMPDWAEECPACGRPKAEAPKRQTKKTNSNSSSAASGAAAAEQKDNRSGEYHYTYKKASDTGRAGQNTSRRRRSYDKGTFTYDADEPRTGGGTFTYEGEEFTGSRDYAGEYKHDAKKNKLLGALCYFGPLFLLSWLLKPKSRFVRYHVNQGLVLFLVEVIIWMFDFIPFVGLLNILAIVCFFCGISNALKGKRKPIPLIGEITLIK